MQTMSHKDLKPQIYYYIRRKWYDQLVQFCDNVISKKGKDPLTVFWKAFGLGKSGHIPDCIRLLESFQSRRDMQYPVSLALLHFHKQAMSVDHDAIDALNAELSIAQDVTKEAGMILAARFSFFVGNLSLASQIVSTSFNLRGQEPSTPIEYEAACINYWIALDMALEGDDMLDSDSHSKLLLLDTMLHGRVEQSDVDTLMAWAFSKLIVKRTGEALNIFNQIIAAYQSFLPALIDKMLLLASVGEWDQALDAAQRVLDADADNTDALMVIAMHAFTQESQMLDAIQKLEELDASMLKREPKAVVGLLMAAQLFSGVCSRNSRALQVCVRMLERAQRCCADNSEHAQILCQLGNIYLMLGSSQFQNATRVFRDASKKDSNNIQAIEGMILCSLQNGLYEDAEGQIELITVMHDSSDLSSQFLYLQALHARQGSNRLDKHLIFLGESREKLFDRAKKAPLVSHGSVIAFSELRIINPDFSMVLAMEYLEHIESMAPVITLGKSMVATDSTDINIDSTTISTPVLTGLSLLDSILRQCPGISCVYIETARSYLSLRKDEDAMRILHQCMSLQPLYAAGLIAIARVELSKHNINAADRSLEQALSCDFSIRNVPLFRLAQISVRAQQGRIDDAIDEMEKLIKLPDFIQVKCVDDNNFTDALRLIDNDRVGAFILYAALLSRARRLKEANKVLSEAKVLFAGSSQEVQVLVAASQLAVEKGDFDNAIRVLEKISDDSPLFMRAQIIKADIFLIHNRDKEGFTQCYKYIVDNDPSAKNYALLGEAYLRILNPEAAIIALEQAYKLDNSNARLRGRIGCALVATHEYHKAVEFYEEAIVEASKQKSSNSGPRSKRTGPTIEAVVLSHDLARLYTKLGRIEESVRILEKVLHEEHRDITDYRQDVTTLILLSRVQKDINRNAGCATLERAHSLQKEVLSQVRSNVATSSEVIDTEKEILSDICEKLGSHFSTHSDDSKHSKTESYYSESIQHNPMNVNAMLGMTKLFKKRGEGEQAILQCRKIILADSSDEEAANMLSELLFHSMDPDEALQPLLVLLSKYPNNYRALETLLSLLRRSGRLDEASALITAAVKADPRSGSHAGLNFCKGLYARYTNDVGKAIVEFNLARNDDKWGPDALSHMIELYLNPNQEGAWEEKDAGPLDEAAAANVAAAGVLLKELKPKSTDKQRTIILENYYLLGTRQKSNIDLAMQSFISLLEMDQDYLPAVLGMATGFMIEKNQHKAHNLLKRVAKMEASKHDGDDFCKANLLLAKFFVDKSLYDQAKDLCKRCLAQNKSSSQAWDILGLIMEKGGDYERASESYEKSWKLEFESSPPVGFKLAFSYLKSKKFVEAIDICEKVLQDFPDYPRIKDEILKKAQYGLRTT